MFTQWITRSASLVDGLVAGSIIGRSQKSRAQSKSESLGARERIEGLAAIRQTYAPMVERVDAFFGVPEMRRLEIGNRGRRSTREAEYEVVDVRWESRVEPYCREIRDRFLATGQNHQAAARLIRSKNQTRGTAILIHGYRAGQYGLEERVWPIDWLLDQGLDVALYVLPFHAIRAESGRAARFPSSDPRFTIEGFRQAISDLRDLTFTLRRDGAPKVVAMGMSLGGYTTSLLTTLGDLDFSAPMIPLASFGEMAMAAGRLVGTAKDQAEQLAALDAAHEIVGPFTRPSRLEARRVIVAGGEGDRITPIAHAESLARHFGSDLVRFPGGHLLQIGRRAAFKAIGQRLRELSILAPR